jgi:hypothetical protein
MNEEEMERDKVGLTPYNHYYHHYDYNADINLSSKASTISPNNGVGGEGVGEANADYALTSKESIHFKLNS